MTLNPIFFLEYDSDLNIVIVDTVYHYIDINVSTYVISIMNRVVTASWVVVHDTKDTEIYGELILVRHEYNFRIIDKLEISSGKSV